MKTIFFGTPDYVLPILESLHKSFNNPKIESGVVAVVTQKPKPKGRKKILTYSPVDTWAYKKKIPIYFDSQDLIKNKIEAEVGVLASYGSIIPEHVIEYLPKGILNIHPSLLPKWRGASPVQASIVMAEKQTGVSIIKIDEQVDHGPIVSQFSEEILPEDTAGTLRARLFERSAKVLTTLLPAYLKGKITLRDQEHKKATFTTLLKKGHAFIPPKYLSATLQGLSFKGKLNIPFIKDFLVEPSPPVIERFIRAMQPWPIAWTLLRLSSSGQAKRLKILKAHLEEMSNVRLVLDEVQLEGKNPVSWKQFRQAYNVQF